MAFLGNLFKKEVRSVLGIDIGSSSIKVVQITKKNSQAVLETYGELSLGPYGNSGVGQSVVLPAETISRALNDLMKEKEVNVTTNKCGMSIPFASSLMSVMELPEVSSKQLSVMVPLEARKYIPVPISEVMLDWSIIPKTEIVDEDREDEGSKKDGPNKAIPKINVLVVAIHNATLARFQEIVAKSKVLASFFEIEIFSTMRSVLDDTITPVMIVDMGASSTKLYIVERGVVQESHTVNRGSQEITLSMSRALNISVDEAEVIKRESGLMTEDKNVSDIISLTLGQIFTEANRTLLAFEKKRNKTVSKVMMVGGGAALKGLVDLAKNNFQTDVVVANPFGKLAVPTFLEKVLEETGPEFAVAIGLALRRLAEE